ncbi:MAG: YtxH domain-containing protein [Salinimicrobium sediminis]|uniref:Gas vesicle protein n=1 Tax=Salinimicrobium sediminis TaxID=1343891 RepID=A0A285X7Z8_9FLAO|nr:YtxH domain-containing protein [Salinimicrobium sediminis]MDX1601687.1 YtxH domain-containing protein [Salinimicrobium sediminis]MDX1753904.1 YtxH domain-containing protein [Salinimicrobium sediminis]SOC81415.1 Gas vesicle protein [Salinimicrobium sediminis]
MKTGKILAGILSGAAIGAIAGILFAPKKGADTRKSISEKSNEYMYGAKNKYNDLADNLSHRYDSVKSKMRGKSKQLESNLDGDDKIIY